MRQCIWLLSIFTGLFSSLCAQTSSTYYPAKDRQVGVQELNAVWLGTVGPNQLPYSYLRFGGRLGYYLADGWVSGLSITWEANYPGSQRIQVQRWGIFGMYTRYYLLHLNRWTPYGELGLAYATINHDDPGDNSGAGGLFLPQTGLSFRINDTWSADIGLQYAVASRDDPSIRRRAGSYVKGGLWLHW